MKRSNSRTSKVNNRALTHLRSNGKRVKSREYAYTKKRTLIIDGEAVQFVTPSSTIETKFYNDSKGQLKVSGKVVKINPVKVFAKKQETDLPTPITRGSNKHTELERREHVKRVCDTIGIIGHPKSLSVANVVANVMNPTIQPTPIK